MYVQYVLLKLHDICMIHDKITFLIETLTLATIIKLDLSDYGDLSLVDEWIYYVLIRYSRWLNNTVCCCGCCGCWRGRWAWSAKWGSGGTQERSPQLYKQVVVVSALDNEDIWVVSYCYYSYGSSDIIIATIVLSWVSNTTPLHCDPLLLACSRRSSTCRTTCRLTFGHSSGPGVISTRGDCSIRYDGW